MDTIKNHPLVVAIGVAVVVMTGLAAFKVFVVDTLPWMAEQVAKLEPLLSNTRLWFGFGVGSITYSIITLVRYHRAILNITRDYYAEKSALEHRLDPEHHGGG